MQRFKNFIWSWKLLAIVVMTLALGFVSLPSQYQPENFTPESIKNLKVVLGLDLQGGTQLDYKIDLRNVPEEKHNEIINGVEEVISKRVNKLGVSEPNIYTSKIADEQHIIVELAGVNDIEDAKERVGKTIQLEFKEQKTEVESGEKELVKNQAEELLAKVQAEPDQFEVIGKEESRAYPGKVTYTEQSFTFRDEINGEKLAEAIYNAEPGTIIGSTIEDSAGYAYVENQIVDQTGYFVVQVVDKQETERQINEPKEVKAQHILISYEGAERAQGVTRTKEEAEAKAKEVLALALEPGADFDSLAAENSNEPGAEDSKGILPVNVIDGDFQYVEAFRNAALSLTEVGQVTSEPIKTEFGYHIIKALEIVEPKNETVTEEQVKYNQVFFSTLPDQWQSTELNGEHFLSATVEFNELLQPQVAIQFDSEGAKLFGEITKRNINRPLAIFVGGELISAPNVNAEITGGQAVISGNFELQEAQELARDLNTGAIPAPITLTGQYNIGSTLGQSALQKSIFAALIGLALLSLYMIFYYRIPGILAVLALGIYAIILTFIIKAALPVSLAIVIGLAIGFSAIGKILNNKESSAEKVVSIFIALFSLFFFTFLLREPVVLTLAGFAGVILSIGMAVDANILIFERIKEELRSGRDTESALQIGFQRAWSSIRDSNFSSLITCAILFYFGSSIIRGFALNLAAGILISMFTAITITKTFLDIFARTKLAKNSALWGPGINNKKPINLPIIKNSRIWFTVSGLLILISLGSLFINGLNAGLDFRGGTLMEVSFEQEVDKNTLEAKVNEIITTEVGTDEASEAVVSSSANNVQLDPKLETSEEIGTAQVITSESESGETSYIIRMGYIGNTTHDKIITNLENEFGQLEENRFTTIGPLISSTLKQKAFFSLAIALVMIVLYIAFAFRNVPKVIGPWKFGASAIFALVHDVILILGFFSILQIEIDSLFITALLTIIGFSVHDTIVVFDRIRENLKGFNASTQNFDDVANKALNETMARSLNTSISTLFTLVALVIFGAESIFHFSLALTLGILFGTYSSIFTASPILCAWKKRGK